MQLGRYFRSINASTWIGKINTEIPRIPRNGNCFSACALAFIGGYYRFLSDNDQIRVHRAWKDNNTTNDFDFGQIISNIIINYIYEMDVDIKLQDLSMQKGKNEIYILNSQEITALNVANNGRGKPKWKFDFQDGNALLFLYQPIYSGAGEITFGCSNKGILFISKYVIGFEKAKIISNGDWSHDFEFDTNDSVFINTNLMTVSDNERIKTMVVLPDDYLEKILFSNRKIGFNYRMSIDSPIYYGFRIFLNNEMVNAISNFVKFCKK